MAQNGRAGEALGISTVSSVFGGITSSLVLLLFAPALAGYALKFGPPEYFALAILGLSTVVGMGSGPLLKNLIACAIGLLISTVGMSPQTGYPRFTFDNPYLFEGVDFVSMLIGLFGVSAVLEVAEELSHRARNGKTPSLLPKIGPLLPRWSMVKRLLPTWLTSSAIGNVIGIIPGAGMIMAVYLAYGQAARRSKHGKLGTGVPEGVAAPEAANNAVVASSMVPLLSLGIPGNSTSALFLGALLIQGLRPGPSLFSETPEVGYLIVISFLAANIIMGPMGLLVAKLLSRLIVKLPRELLSASICILCLTGAFAVGNSVFNMWVALVFGVLGYLFNKLEIPHSPVILAVVLGTMMERSLYQSLVLSGGSIGILFERPISLVLLLGALLSVAMPVIKVSYQRLRAGSKSRA
jgi:putative tricarboxylic transport membrane protein